MAQTDAKRSVDLLVNQIRAQNVSAMIAPLSTIRRCVRPSTTYNYQHILLEVTCGVSISTSVDGP